MNEIKWHNRARKQLMKLPMNYRKAIVEAAASLADFPECENVKHLTNHRYDYRMRVGRYRILFDYDGEIKIIEIQEVKKRDERTY